jgi:hypothetical protein
MRFRSISAEKNCAELRDTLRPHQSSSLALVAPMPKPQATPVPVPTAASSAEHMAEAGCKVPQVA